MPGIENIKIISMKNPDISVSAKIIYISKRTNTATPIRLAINPETAPVASESERLDIRDRESDIPTLVMPVTISIIKTNGQTHNIGNNIGNAKKPIKTPGIILVNTAHLKSVFKLTIFKIITPKRIIKLLIMQPITCKNNDSRIRKKVYHEDHRSKNKLIFINHLYKKIVRFRGL